MVLGVCAKEDYQWEACNSNSNSTMESAKRLDNSIMTDFLSSTNYKCTFLDLPSNLSVHSMSKFIQSDETDPGMLPMVPNFVLFRQFCFLQALVSSFLS